MHVEAVGAAVWEARVTTRSIRLSSRPCCLRPWLKSSHDFMGAGAAAKAFNLGVIIISSSRGFAGHDEMDPCLVTWSEEFFIGPPRHA